MGNPMIQVEHCPEVDDARTFEVEFTDKWCNKTTLGLQVTGHGVFHDGAIIIPVDYGNL